MSGQAAWAWYVIPVFLLIAFLLWIASKSGQNLARDEMQQMKNRLDECVASQQ